jgi:oxygen-independent coproporphyrinogen-3 oxidase
MEAAAGSSLGIYISLPFCRSKCTYCNFASGVYPAAEHARYVERVIEDLSEAEAWAKETGLQLLHRVDTVYLGGGTPSLLEPALLTRLFAALHAEFSLDTDAEITMECAPGQISDGTLDAMTACGVNRVSLGVQSFVDREANLSGRLHSRAIVEDDLRRLRAAGINNLNVDLIAGLAEQTFASWEESLTALVDCGVPHASVYMLEVDEDSRLGREMLGGGTRYHAGLVPTDDSMARMYERAIERLSEAGLAQYEISNFCVPQFYSRHNLRYWERRPYLGLGLDASSMLLSSQHERRKKETDYIPQGLKPPNFLGPSSGTAEAVPFQSVAESRQDHNGRALRSTTRDDLKAYLTGPQPAEMTWLTREQQHEEAWFLGLRLNAGVEVAAMEREFGGAAIASAMERVGRMVDAGLLRFDGNNVRLTARGRLLSNEVFQEFLELTPAEAQQV